MSGADPAPVRDEGVRDDGVRDDGVRDDGARDDGARDDALTRATAAITVARSVQMASFLCVGMFLARRFDGATYGTYQHVPLIAQAVPIAVAVPVAKTVLYFAPRSTSPDRFLRAMAALLLAAGVVAGGAIAAFPGALRIFDRGDAALVALRPLVGAIVALSFAQSVTEYVLIARGRRSAVPRVMIAQGLWSLVAIGGAAWFAPESSRLPWTLAALATATAIPACATFWCLLVPSGAPRDATGPAARDVAAYAMPLVLSAGVGYAAAQIDRLLVPLLFPMDRFPEAKDHYLRAAMEVPILATVGLTAISVAAPQLVRMHARGDAGGLLALWRRTCRSTAIATLPVTGLLCATAFEAFTLVWGERYEPAVPVFRWTLLRIVVAVFLPQVLLEYMGATTRSLVSSLAALFTATALTVLLVPVWGLVGAAAAAAVAQMGVHWLLGGWLARGALGVRWTDLLDWDQVVRLGAACGVAAWAAIALVPDGLFGGLPRVARLLCVAVLHGSAYTVLFIVASRLLRAVAREDVELLRRVLRRRGPGA